MLLPLASSPDHVSLLNLLSLSFTVVWLFILPGILLSRLCGFPSIRDWPTKIALWFVLGLSFWPILLLWTSTLGLTWSAFAAQITIMLVGMAGFLLLWFGSPNRTVSGLKWHRLKTWQGAMWPILAVIIGVITLWNRLLHVRDLVLPNWVDSIHHMMITRLLIEQGKIPETFAPFMPDGQFFYHWGFHATLTWLAWARGATDAFGAAHLMLTTGQLFSSLTLLMLYVAGRWLYGSRRAGVIVAVFGGLVSWFPAYYISWGRYTHLAGILYMAPLGFALWRLHTDERHSVAWGAITTLLASGLLLTHVRVAFFVATFAVTLAIPILIQQQWRTLGRWVMAGLATLIVTAPWLWRFVFAPQTAHLGVLEANGQNEWWSGLNTITWSLVWVPGIHELMAIATGGLSALLGWGEPELRVWLIAISWLIVMLVALTTFLWIRLRQKPTVLRYGLNFPWRPLGLTLGWSGLTMLLINLDQLGLPTLGFMTNNSAVITLFAPLSLLAGGVAAWATGVLTPRRFMRPITTLLVVVLSLWGAYQMGNIVNVTTTLARPADLRALRWIRENTPPDALFAVNVKLWLGDTFAGTDAGYWIPILSDRASILPPALYPSAMPHEQVAQMNAFFRGWHTINDLDDPAVRSQLQAMGVTHIYLGSRGGHLALPLFLDKPYVTPVFADEGVHVYELEKE